MSSFSSSLIFNGTCLNLCVNKCREVTNLPGPMFNLLDKGVSFIYLHSILNGYLFYTYHTILLFLMFLSVCLDYTIQW